MEPLSKREVDQLLDEYEQSYDGTDTQIERELVEILPKQDHLTKAQVQDIIRWKMAGQGGRADRYVEMLDRVSTEVVQLVTAAAFLTPDLKTQLKILSSLPGIGYATATVVLTFHDPENYAVGDRYINEEVLGLDDTPVTPSNYEALLDELRDLNTGGFDLRDLEKAYYMRYLKGR